MNRDASRDAEWELAFAGEINTAVLQEYGRGYWADLPGDSLVLADDFNAQSGNWPDFLSPRQQQLSAASH